MNNVFDLSELYGLQARLDETIALKHGTSYESTKDDRLLALLVEISELANETRVFKYWSTKGPSNKNILLDEYADGLHFFLSIGVALKTKKFSYVIQKENLSLTKHFHELFALISKLIDNYNIENYTKAIQLFLNLILSLNFTILEVKDAYLKKLQENYKRQENNY
ncbi:MAG: dUTP diphosphatase [Bacilli bacterium]|jgi:dimeric dUTPase (all-alpha-NTP-PPase superfamily)|nr:dUTP diphosphatase [Bacilli bacterium]NLN80715.1 dUTPase [Erysipelotrichia bacterium]